MSLRFLKLRNRPRSARRPVSSELSRLIRPLSWCSLGLFVVVDVVWFSVSSLQFAPSSFWIIVRSWLFIALAYCVFRLTLSRLRDDHSKIGCALRSVAHGGDLLVRVLAFSVCWGVAGVTFMCLATSAALPLQDARLASLDHVLGFDWLEFLILANSSWVASWILVAAYHSALPQLILLYLLLCFSGRQRRLGEFLALSSITSVAVGALMVLVPAGGAYPYYQPQRELFGGFSANAGMWHYETFSMFRTQANPLLDFGKMEGLVTFPSYHTVLAIITTYAVRGIRFIALPAAILNCIVIVSTLPEGGHFLVDVLAGAVVAGVGIALVRWEQSGWIIRAPRKITLAGPTPSERAKDEASGVFSISSSGCKR